MSHRALTLIVTSIALNVGMHLTVLVLLFTSPAAYNLEARIIVNVLSVVFAVIAIGIMLRVVIKR